MSDPTKNETDSVPDQSIRSRAGTAEPERAEERMEDEEKILAGRHDVNYPALLTKDVPGG